MGGPEATFGSGITRIAVISGSNKGIGFGICKKLAGKGITVVLTARDVEKGAQAVEMLKGSFGIPENLVYFHQLDVTDQSSVDSLFDFIKSTFGKLDILINNAGISEILVENASAFEHLIQDFSTFQCLETNYYGKKRMTEAFLPLLMLSNSPRIVNVSSSLGKLEFLSNEWAIGILSNIEGLTENKIDEVINAFLKDYKEGSFIVKGWPSDFPAYKLSKAASNAYTRMIAKKYPPICINAVDPGYVQTDATFNTGDITPDEAAETSVHLVMLPDGGPSGLFFEKCDVIPF